MSLSMSLKAKKFRSCVIHSLTWFRLPEKVPGSFILNLVSFPNGCVYFLVPGMVGRTLSSLVDPMTDIVKERDEGG